MIFSINYTHSSQAGPGIALYFKEFYQHVIDHKLNPGGVLVTQSGAGSILNSHECFSTINNTLKSVFNNVYAYTAPIPSFGCDWGYNLAFNTCAHENVDTREPAEIDAAIAEMIKDDKGMFFLDGITYRGQMNVSKPIRDVITKETRVMCVETPVYMH